MVPWGSSLGPIFPSFLHYSPVPRSGTTIGSNSSFVTWLLLILRKTMRWSFLNYSFRYSALLSPSSQVPFGIDSATILRECTSGLGLIAWAIEQVHET